MDQPALDNRTDFKVHPQMLLDRDGERLVVIVKATFEIAADGELEVAPPARARGVRFADFPWEKEKPESIAYPADVCVRKPGTDVVLVAQACAPGGRAVPSFDVRVEVGPLKKSLVVFGKRLWADKGAALTQPQPIAELDLRYDHAWGGRDDEEPPLLEEAQNPVGTGVTKNAAQLTHKPAPHIEDPAYPIRSAKTSPPPAGVGPVGRSWEPRRRFAGTYDAIWLETRAPMPPDDLDDRFNQCASSGLVADPPLVGGEAVRLLNLVPGGGPLALTLPKVVLDVLFRVAGREPVVVTPHLDTVLIDLFMPSAKKPMAIEMVWRASVPAPRRMKDASIIVRERKLA